MRFDREPDRRCQRGLTFVYVTDGHDAHALAAALDAAFGERLLGGETRLGGRVALRRILQFRFEVRLTEGAEHIRFMHRATAGAKEREEDRRAFEDVLRGHAEPVG